jgi:hypothetical protein
MYANKVKRCRIWSSDGDVSLDKWSYELFYHVVLWLYTNVSEQHAASISSTEVRNVGKLMGYIWLGGGTDQEDSAISK